jgi:hypothetical protein
MSLIMSQSYGKETKAIIFQQKNYIGGTLKKLLIPNLFFFKLFDNVEFDT